MVIHKGEYCYVGDCNEDGDRAHLITRATLPEGMIWHDDMYIYLCRRHHSEQHNIGIVTFCMKYNLIGYLDKAKGAKRNA